MSELIRDASDYADAVRAVTGEYPIITAITLPDDVAPPTDPYAAYMLHREACVKCGHGHKCDEGLHLLTVALEDF